MQAPGLHTQSLPLAALKGEGMLPIRKKRTPKSKSEGLDHATAKVGLATAKIALATAIVALLVELVRIMGG